MAVWTPEERLNYIYGFIKVDRKDIDLDFYQDAIIQTNSKYVAVLKARQIGWSFLLALKGLAMACDPGRFKYTKQFVSYNEDDAKEKIRYAVEFYESIPSKHKKKLKKCSVNSMEFYDIGGKTTSRLISIACRQPRGKNGDISLDEAAFFPVNRARQIYTAAVNAIVRGGRLEVGSTPFGTSGLFYDIMTNRNEYKNYTRYQIPWWYSRVHCKDIEAAAREASELDTETRVKKYGTPGLISIYDASYLEDFQQEQECSFVDSIASFIPIDLIHANTPGMREGERIEPLGADDAPEDTIEIRVAKNVQELYAMYDKEKHGFLYIGYDVARRRDAAVVYVIATGDGKKKSLAEIEFRNVKFEEQLDTIRQIIRGLPVVRCCMDKTGMGEPLFETLQNEFGDKVEGIQFTSEAKEVLVLAVKRGLEQQEFLLPNSHKFHAQILSIKREPTAVGRFRYDADRTASGHADSFWAWALANHAISQEIETKSFYQERLEKAGKNKESGILSKRGKTAEDILRGMRYGRR